MRGMVVGEGGRSSGVLLYWQFQQDWPIIYKGSLIFLRFNPTSQQHTRSLLGHRVNTNVTFAVQNHKFSDDSPFIADAEFKASGNASTYSTTTAISHTLQDLYSDTNYCWFKCIPRWI